MRCLVTGATGFLGSHLCRFLLEQGWEVAVVIRPDSDTWRISDVLNRLHIIAGDLTTMPQCAALIREFAPETVFHLAWFGVGHPHRNDIRQVNLNLLGSVNLLQISKEAGCSCFISVGSQAEYERKDGIITENDHTNPETLYGIAKLSTGLLLNKLCELENIRFVWFRLFAIYGPMDNPSYLIPFLVRSCLQNTVPALTAGEQRFDYLYVEDAATAIAHAAEIPAVSGVFNLGSGQAFAIRSIAEKIRDLSDPALPLGFGKIPYRPNQPMLWQADITRLQQATGWIPRMDLDSGLEKTVAWYRAHL